MKNHKNYLCEIKKISKLSWLVTLLLFGTFWNCSENDDFSSSYIQNGLSEGELESIHKEVKSSFQEEMTAYENNEERYKVRNAKVINNFNLAFEKNLNAVNEKGIDNLFEKKDINQDILSALTFYENNYLNPSIYSLLDVKFNFGVEDAKKLFQLIEIIRFIEKNAQNFYNRSFRGADKEPKDSRISRGGGISRDCVEAIGGTLLATAGAATVGGPLGLGLFLVAKGYSIYQLVRACG